ncbi:MAG: hypothetical protein AAFV07_09070, partial [Bacteroidota bacterium]
MIFRRFPAPLVLCLLFGACLPEESSHTSKRPVSIAPLSSASSPIQQDTQPDTLQLVLQPVDPPQVEKDSVITDPALLDSTGFLVHFQQLMDSAQKAIATREYLSLMIDRGEYEAGSWYEIYFNAEREIVYVTTNWGEEGMYGQEWYLLDSGEIQAIQQMEGAEGQDQDKWWAHIQSGQDSCARTWKTSVYTK